MKKRIILLLLVSIQSYILSAQHSASNKFTLRLTLAKGDMKFLQLQYKDENGKRITDTSEVKDGVFVFTGYINGPTEARFVEGKNKSGSVEDNLFLEPGNMKGTLIGNDFKNATITGSVTQHEFEMLKKKKKVNDLKTDKLWVELQEVDKKRHSSDSSQSLDELRNQIVDKMDEFNALNKQIEIDFIVTHPGSYLSPYLMINNFLGRKITVDSAEKYIKSFHEPVQKSVYGQEVSKLVRVRKLSATGSEAPMISQTDLNGQEINLSMFKEKNYVLLDFWASWCVPCRKITPRIIEFYQKYHSKGLEIISMSWDQDKKPWVEAINKDGMNSWHNTLIGYFGLVQEYSISSIPTLILIDKKGVIVGRYGGNDENGDENALFAQLEKIFN